MIKFLNLPFIALIAFCMIIHLLPFVITFTFFIYFKDMYIKIYE